MGKKKYSKEQFVKPEAVIVEISPKEFAYGIYTFEIKSNTAHLSGLYRNGIIENLGRRGYCKRYRSNNTYIFVREQNNILDAVEPVLLKDELFSYIQKTYTQELIFNYKAITVVTSAAILHETFLKQSHLIFNDKFLEHLPNHTKPVLRDTREFSYFPFLNGIVKISAKAIITIPYSDLHEYCIWREHIVNWNYTETDYTGCHFEQFLINVTNKDQERFLSFLSAIGYLLHNYSNKSKGQAVIAYDEEITDLKKPMGGTGKGITKQALSQLRKIVKVDGKKFDEKDKFSFQEITEATQIVFFDDVKAEMGFDRFNSILTEGWNIEPKWKPAFYIAPEDSPKVYITSNAILRSNGSTSERRQFIIEFSNFYSKLVKEKLEPIKHIHNCEFFTSDWDESEWNKFYSLMLFCSKFYMAEGLREYKRVSVKKNMLRQNTSEDFCEWLTARDIKFSEQYTTSVEFNEFKNTYYGENSDFKQRGFTNWLKIYAESEGKELKTWRSNSIVYFHII